MIIGLYPQRATRPLKDWIFSDRNDCLLQIAFDTICFELVSILIPQPIAICPEARALARRLRALFGFSMFVRMSTRDYSCLRQQLAKI